MIYEVEGDILMSRAEVIAQGVAINDPMASGLARKLQEKFPGMRDAFNEWCESTDPEPGEIWRATHTPVHLCLGARWHAGV